MPKKKLIKSGNCVKKHDVKKLFFLKLTIKRVPFKAPFLLLIFSAGAGGNSGKNAITTKVFCLIKCVIDAVNQSADGVVFLQRCGAHTDTDVD